MASARKPRGRMASRFHFLIRFLGLTGFVALIVGVVLVLVEGIVPGWDGARDWLDNLQTIGLSAWQVAQTQIQGLLDGKTGEWPPRIAVGLLVIGGAFFLLAVLVEGLVGLRFLAGRRSAVGSNALIQTALALTLVVGLNWWYAFSEASQPLSTFKRIDCTRGQQFTLPDDVQAQLRKLRDEKEKTTIVVYQRHKTFGSLSEKPDRFDYAAERKVVEKVQDVVDQFREFGPQFQVMVLDVEQEDFDSKLAGLPAGLRLAVDKAPENSIFFHHSGRVQRLSFNDFYHLDKTGSQQAQDGRGNLVLRYQGVEPFARMVLNVEEKKPRIAVGVIHEVLSMEGGSEEIGMGGVKKSLAAHGFEARDLILKKWPETAPPEAAVFTFDESKLEQIDEQIKELEASLKQRDEDLKSLTKEQDQWKRAPLAELNASDLAEQLGIAKKVTEDLRNQVLTRVLEPHVSRRQVLNEFERKELDTLRKERAGLSRAEETLAERRRDNDLKAKTARLLADCDLLVLPRMTLFNVARSEAIRAGLYRLDPAQVAAIREYVRSGKPILACLGPVNEPAGRPDPEGGGADGIEEMLAQLGVKLTRQTVLFNVESKSFAQRRGGLLIPGANVDVPPLKLEWEPGAGRPTSRALAADQTQPNSLHESLRLTARSLGQGQSMDVRLRHPRPVYYDPESVRLPQFLSLWAAAPDAGSTAGLLPWLSLGLYSRVTKAADVDAEFLMADAESWNESQPFPTRERTPRYEPPKPEEAAGDPFERRRLGPFPVGVAAEVTDWNSMRNEPTTTRVAVIGHGGVFMGPTLTPAREKLLIDTSNWLLGREQRLTRSGSTWSFPRVAMEEKHQTLWVLGTQAGLPFAFFYLGIVVIMLRYLR